MLVFWKKIPDWPYYISSDGQVMNFNGKILANRPDANGYLRVCLCNGPQNHLDFYVHRLVCFAFLENSHFDGAEVDHKNKLVSDNRIYNLRWVTSDENKSHRDIACGERSKKSNLTDSDIYEIRRRTKTKIPGFITSRDRRLASEFGVSRESIRDIRLNKCWRHING